MPSLLTRGEEASQKYQISVNRERARPFVGPSNRIYLLTRIFVGSITVKPATC